MNLLQFALLRDPTELSENLRSSPRRPDFSINSVKHLVKEKFYKNPQLRLITRKGERASQLDHPEPPSSVELKQTVGEKRIVSLFRLIEIYLTNYFFFVVIFCPLRYF